MSCIPCVEEGEGSCSIPAEDVERWTHSLQQLLNSQDGVRHLREFLTSRHFDESVATLDFWREAQSLLRHPRNTKVLTAGHSRSSSLTGMQFQQKAKQLCSVAENDLNFDLAQLRSLNNAVISGDQERIQSTFRDAMQTACELMEDDYQLFRKHLLKQRGLLK